MALPSTISSKRRPEQMERSRDYLQGAYDAASWANGVLERWGEIEARRKLEDLTSTLLTTMEENFMDVFGAEWPEAEPRREFFHGPAVEGDGIDGTTPDP